ncbi:uncharacterized protein LOC143144905 [Ptiloglossa arizonensis]|uniref:uncharacterized protein LOC143144905 n=1 Tax=Ptiloglossa arizonensis TaxID=3350558 RepID=UPI003FA143D2
MRLKGIKPVMGVKNFKHQQNIGTVLFEKSDSIKHCWSAEDFIMLNSRRMFQDLLPKVKVLNYENDRYIALLMDYFHICLESVRKLSIGKTKHLMLKALADTMGGYLQVYILPLTRHSYYAGNIKYRNARKLFELYDELKLFLGSNGAGWLKPSKCTESAKIPPIVITPPRTSIACEGIITYPACKNIVSIEVSWKLVSFEGRKWRISEAVLIQLYTKDGYGSYLYFALEVILEISSTNHNRRELQRFMFKKMKRTTRKKHKASRKKHHNASPKKGSIVIPLPFLDDEVEPNSIALPFKKDSLQSLYVEHSAFVLVKYYVGSVKCIISKSKTKTELESFNQEFSNWLQQSVRRRLDDEKWYPAFGGVLRVISTLEESGAETGLTAWRKSGTHQMMPKIGVPPTIEVEEVVQPFYKSEDGDTRVTLGTTELISIAVVSALLVWLLVGLSLVCYRFLVKHSDECGPCEPQQPPIIGLYENKEFCQQYTCSTRAPRKGLFEKLVGNWRNKFGKCRGDCQNHCNDEERCLAAISYSSKDTVDVSTSSRSYQKRKFTKSVSATFSSVRKGRLPIKNVHYSSDGSLTTNTESPGKLR